MRAVAGGATIAFACASIVAAACTGEGAESAANDRAASPPSPSTTTSRGQFRSDSAARAFGDTVVAMLLDTQLYELRGDLFLKIRNPDQLDESPLADRRMEHAAVPGPHTWEGALHAEIGALRAALGDAVPVSIEEDRVFVRNPPVLIPGHHHGENLYVPVKSFARQYGAYVDITCTPATCGIIWTRPILEFMRDLGGAPGTGLAEAHAEGLIKGVDVRARLGG